MGKRSKVFFISDAHLGTPDFETSLTRERDLTALLEQIKSQAAAIYLMGDIFDFWYEYKHVVPRGYTRLLGKLSELSDQGVDIHFFTGNHDIWAFDYLTEECGITIHRHPMITDILGKSFFLAHGDGLDESDRKFRFIKRIFTNKFLQWCFSRLHPNFAFSLAKKWSRYSRDHQDADPFLEESEPFVLFSRNNLMEESLDYHIYGHRHCPVKYPLNEKTSLVILGDWFSQNHYAVFDGKSFDLLLFDPHSVERAVNKK